DRSSGSKEKRSTRSGSSVHALICGVEVRLQVATRSPASRNDCTSVAPRPRLPPVTMTVLGAQSTSVPGPASVTSRLGSATGDLVLGDVEGLDEADPAGLS